MVDQSSPTLTSDKHVNFVQDVSIRHLTNLNLRTLAFLGTEDYLSTSRIPMLKFSENGENQNFDIGNLAAKGLRTHWMHLIFHVTLTIKRGPLLSSGSSLDILAHLGNWGSLQGPQANHTRRLSCHLMPDIWTPFIGFLYSSNAEPRYSLFPVRSRPPESGFDGVADGGIL